MIVTGARGFATLASVPALSLKRKQRSRRAPRQPAVEQAPVAPQSCPVCGGPFAGACPTCRAERIPPAGSDGTALVRLRGRVSRPDESRTRFELALAGDVQIAIEADQQTVWVPGESAPVLAEGATAEVVAEVVAFFEEEHAGLRQAPARKLKARARAVALGPDPRAAPRASGGAVRRPLLSAMKLLWVKIALVVLFACAFVLAPVSTVTHRRVVRAALELVERCPVAREHLGETIGSTWGCQRSDCSCASGKLAVPVSGSRGRGELIFGFRSEDQVSIQDAQLRVRGGRIDLESCVFSRR